MAKNLLNYSWIFLIGATSFFASCNQDNTTNSADLTDFVNTVISQIQEGGNIGRTGCYELVFPITINFPDETTATVNSYDELKDALRTWREANPNNTEMPTLGFPIEVIAPDGEVITVNTKEELDTLKASCPRDTMYHHEGPGGHHGPGGHPGFGGTGGHGGGDCFCFEIVFPVTILFPDSTTTEVADEMAFKTAVRAWHDANHDATGRPELVFPITVKLADGTTQTVESKEALQALKDSCSMNN